MTKPALPTVTLPEFKLPELDIDALFTSQKANLAVMQEAQNVLVEAAHAIARVQYDWTVETIAGGEAALRAKQPKQPEALAADIQSAAEKAVAVAKQAVDLAAAAQQRVAELIAKRVAANLDEFKSLAA